MTVKQRNLKDVFLPMAMAAALVVAGCTTSSSIGNEFDATKAKELAVGKSSKSDILVSLGEPLRRSQNLDGSEAWTYDHQSVDSRLTGAAVLGGYAMLAGIDTSKSKYTKQTLLLEIREGVLTYCLLKVVQGDEKGGVFGEGMQESMMSGNRSTTTCAGSSPEAVPTWMQSETAF